MSAISCGPKPSADYALLGSHIWPRIQGRHASVQMCYMNGRAKYHILVLRTWRDGTPSTYMEVWPQPGYNVKAKRHKATLSEDIADRIFLLTQKCFREFKIARSQAGLKGSNSLTMSYDSGIEHIGAQFFRGQNQDRYPSLEALLKVLWPHVPQRFQWKQTA
ncbi:MAG: hypothetical protein GY845_37580 [Planctomycetes bacterium]|nr:hypothetical protein [Planctomycetota bacterium]